MKKSKLDSDQKQVVRFSKDRDLFVDSGPGSGKSTTAAWRYGMREKTGDDVAMLFFDNSARKSVEEKIEDIWGQDIKLRTFHSVAKQIVESHYEKVGYNNSDIEVDTDDSDVISVAMERVLTNREYEDPSDILSNITDSAAYKLGWMFDEAINEGYVDGEMLTEDIVDRMVNEDELHSIINFLKEEFTDIFKEYQQIHVSQNTISYRLMMYFGHRLLVDEGVKTKFHLMDEIMVDEGQDLNRIQYQIADNIAENRLTIVCDPFQTIFEFKGADPQIMEDFQDERKPISLNLTRNYRSEENLVEFFNDIKDLMDPQSYDLVPTRDTDKSENDPVRFNDQNLSKYIEELKNQGYDYSDIAIIPRRKSRVRSIVQDLELEGIPAYNETDDTSFSDIDVVQEVKQLFGYMENGEDDVIFELIERYVDGVGDSGIKSLKEGIRMNGLENDEITEVPESDVRGMSKKLEKVKDFVESLEMIENVPDASKLETLRRKIIERNRGTLSERYEIYGSILEDMFEQSGYDTENFLDMIEEKDDQVKDDSVTVVHAHIVKGREFPVVINPTSSHFSYHQEHIDLEVFYTICTRAEDRLLFMKNKDERSPVLKRLGV